MTVAAKFLIAVTTAALSLSAQTPGKKTAEQMKASYEAHRADFDYLLGDWEFTSVSKKYGPGKGIWSAVRLPGGQIMDEFRIIGDAGETYYMTTSVRAYNAALDAWELISMEGVEGLQNRGTGRRAGAEVHIEQKFGATSEQPFVLRIRYFDIDPSRFSWSADRSNDGGQTWVKDDQHIEARRVGPARSLEPLAQVRKASGK